METNRKAEDYLVVAADFKPGKEGVKGVRDEVLKLAEELKGTGVGIKVNSILRACGYELIAQLHDLGLKVMADLKLVDIDETMEIDAMLLKEYKPEILTVMCNASVAGMRRVKNQFKDTITEVLGVTVLTTFDDDECFGVYGCTSSAGVVRFARLAKLAEIDGVVNSVKELGLFSPRSELSALSSNTPGIRPVWGDVKKDDQVRVGTPEHAIINRAKRIIIGRPITQAENRLDALKKTRDEIQAALDSLASATAKS